MNDQPTLFDTGNTLVDSLFRRARVLGSEGQIENIRITKREIEVMSAKAKGMSKGQIAVFLGISINTVKTHMEHVRNKTGLDTTGSIILLTRRGLIK